MRKRTALVWVFLLACFQTAELSPAPKKADVLIIGAGIAGLTAALEAARAQATVIVIDLSTVGGGHAIVSNGAVCLVDTPFQRAKSVSDSVELAERDFLARGEDADSAWVKRYVHESKTQIYDWLTELGVEFDALVKPPGNSVQRLHLTRGKGWGLVGPLFRECLRHPRIDFVWATQAEKLLIEKGAVVGVLTRNLRTGRRADFKARNVIVATGGFQGNLELARKNWPADLPTPEVLLVGAAHTATGSGHAMVREAGGTLSRMDHQWNYVLGLPDPRDPSRQRGLAAFNFNSIWVNREGKRFTQEFGDPKTTLPALLRQPGSTYWSVFDEKGKRGFTITLAGWENFNEVSELIFGAPGLVTRAATLEELAGKTGLSKEGLSETVRRYNQLTEDGVDLDFSAFGPKTSPKPKKIETPPFYAAQFFPITRKSMGGISVDLRCQVLSSEGKPIPGLYAVGEVTGFGGLNGKAALEGTFLGPSVLMGRIAGKASSQEREVRNISLRQLPEKLPASIFPNEACISCHRVAEDVSKKRAGYWHFEQSHAKVLGRKYTCAQCHQDLYPHRKRNHVMNRMALTNSCATCHGVQSAGP